jgi:enoyl-CoA hydratase
MTETAAPELLVEVRNRIAYLTFNRPRALNALSYEMLVQMRQLFDQWAKDDSIVAVVSRGAGEKAYCAGGDVRGLYNSVTGKGPRVHEQFFITEYTLNYQLHQFLKRTGKPYIALMNGIVMGGGMGVSQGATLRIVGERTKMAMPETKIGLFPDVGGTYFLSRATDATGLYLGMTSNMFTGADAMFAKLADAYMHSDNQPAFLAALDAMQWQENPLAQIVACVKTFSTSPPESEIAQHNATISRCFANKASGAEVLAALRHDHDAWAHRIAHDLSLRSPLMVEVTKQQVERGHKMALADCLRLELNMMFAAFEHPDVVEGIRALVIDKDNQPRWQHTALDAVNANHLAAFFTPRWTADTHPLAALESAS